MKQILTVLISKLYIIKKHLKKILISIITLIILLGALVGFKKYYSYYDYESMSIFDYIKRSDDELNITIASLILSKEYDTYIQFDKYYKFIDEIAGRVQHLVGERTDPDFRIAAINTVLYREYKFSYDTTDFTGSKAENHFLSSVLDRKQGVCSTMPLVYIVVAEKLNYPIYAVSAPECVNIVVA